MCNRALLHEQGIGGPPNIQAAIELYERAIDLNEPCSMYNRALMYEEEIGGPQNITKAIALHERAIDLNETYAMRHRAWMHEQGIGGPQDIPAAFNLYEKAIAHGDLAAIDMLQQHLLNYSEEQTSNLFNSLWQSLIEGEQISQTTLEFLTATYRNHIIQNLTVLIAL